MFYDIIHGYLQGITDGETDEPGADRVPIEDGKDRREEYNEVADHLEAHRQPAIGDAARVVTRLVMIHEALRYLNKPLEIYVISIDKKPFNNFFFFI